MAEKKQYSFSNGIKASQDELTIEQDYKLMDLLSELGIEEGKDLLNTPIKDLLRKLAKDDLLSKLLNIILEVEGNPADEAGPVDWKKLKNSELQEVIADFFTLNPLVLQLLTALGSVPATMNMNTKSSDSEAAAENTTQDS